MGHNVWCVEWLQDILKLGTIHFALRATKVTLIRKSQCGFSTKTRQKSSWRSSGQSTVSFIWVWFPSTPSRWIINYLWRAQDSYWELLSWKLKSVPFQRHFESQIIQSSLSSLVSNEEPQKTITQQKNYYCPDVVNLAASLDKKTWQFFCRHLSKSQHSWHDIYKFTVCLSS